MIKTTLARITDSRFRPFLEGHEVLTSLEGENPGGSIKDRMVLGELSDWLQKGVIKPGDTVAEISAGSTALSLAHYCRQLHLKCHLFVPLSLNPEKLRELRDLGADLHLLDPAGAYEKYDESIRSTGIRKFDQFGNKNLRRHYHALAADLKKRENAFHAIVGAVGTGHSLAGIGQAVPTTVRLVSAEPTEKGAVSGIRNLRLESFGDKDPCDPAMFQRVELDVSEYFPDSRVQTDMGLIDCSESFRVVLGAVAKLTNGQPPMSIFAVGSNNFRVSALA